MWSESREVYAIVSMTILFTVFVANILVECSWKKVSFHPLRCYPSIVRKRRSQVNSSPSVVRQQVILPNMRLTFCFRRQWCSRDQTANVRFFFLNMDNHLYFRDGRVASGFWILCFLCSRIFRNQTRLIFRCS